MELKPNFSACSVIASTPSSSASDRKVTLQDTASAWVRVIWLAPQLVPVWLPTLVVDWGSWNDAPPGTIDSRS